MTPSENDAVSERGFVVDASALLAWVQNENGGAVVEDLDRQTGYIDCELDRSCPEGS